MMGRIENASQNSPRNRIGSEVAYIATPIYGLIYSFAPGRRKVG
jgi:hypothetical protein